MSAVALADALAFMDAPATDGPLVQSFIDAAEDMIAVHIGSPVAPTAVSERHPGGSTIILRNVWVVAGTAVVTDDTGAVVDYELTPGGLLVSTGSYGGWVTVAYTAGFNPLPPALRLAILYTVQHAYEAQQGAVVVPQGGADESFVTARGFALPNRAKEYLAPYMHRVSVA